MTHITKKKSVLMHNTERLINFTSKKRRRKKKEKLTHNMHTQSDSERTIGGPGASEGAAHNHKQKKFAWQHVRAFL